jgi:hypothetical protein
VRAHRAVPVAAVLLAAFVALSGPSVTQTDVSHESSGKGGGEAASYREVPVRGTSKPPDAIKAPVPVQTTPATPATTRTDPVTPKAKAIAAMAKMLNGPAFQRALDEPRDRVLGPSDAWDASQNQWQATAAMWTDLMDRFRLKGEPLAFRPLVYNDSFEDQEETYCPQLNNGKKVVRSSSPLPFYCPADGKNGVVYWPIKTIEKEWKNADGVPSSVVTRGLDIMMGQRYGEFVAIMVYNTYAGMKGAEEIPRPMQPATEALGYCFAGTALQGQYYDRALALNGLAFAYPAHDDRQVVFARALAFGFDTNSLGKCMLEFWPNN